MAGAGGAGGGHLGTRMGASPERDHQRHAETLPKSQPWPCGAQKVRAGGVQAGRALPPRGWIPRMCDSSVKSLGEQEFHLPSLCSPTLLHLDLPSLVALPVGLGFWCEDVPACCRNWAAAVRGVCLELRSDGSGWSTGETPDPSPSLQASSLPLDLLATPEPSLMNKSSPCSDC